MSLGHALRQLRRQKGLTLAQLAERTDSYVGNLSRLERNVSKPSLDLLYRISQALGFSMSEIFSVSEGATDSHDPQQVALNTIFISLVDTDRELLVEFANLLRERNSRSTDSIAVDARVLPAEHEDVDKPFT